MHDLKYLTFWKIFAQGSVPFIQPSIHDRIKIPVDYDCVSLANVCCPKFAQRCANAYRVCASIRLAIFACTSL